MLTLSAAAFLSVLTVALSVQMPQYEFVEEWNLWKSQHERNYGSEVEELNKHLVWLSNKKYIEMHNANAHVFGFDLAMNHFGDMVSEQLQKYVLPQSPYLPFLHEILSLLPALTQCQYSCLSPYL